MNTATKLRADVAAVRAFADRIMEFAHVYEVRIPDPKHGGPARLFGRQSGYFDDPDELVNELRRITGDDAEAVFVTLNPVDSELQARAVNRLKKSKSATQDADILRRRTLLIDVDSNRPADISATDEERDQALAIRDQIYEFLSEECGWPEPLAITMSGNGGGLLYRIDLPARRLNDKEEWEPDPDSNELIQNVLEALDEKYATKKAGVDTGTANASRITKIIGTVAAKGDNTEKRPWRIATAEYPDDPGTVTREQLEHVAGMKTQPEPKQERKRWQYTVGKTERRWTIEELLILNGLTATPQPMHYGTSYDLDRCLTSDEHTDGACIIEFDTGAVGYTCAHNSCQGKDWHYLKEHGLIQIPYHSEYRQTFSKNGRHADNEQILHNLEWPEPLDDAAYHGLAGDIVHAIDPTTEADPVAVLLSLLVAVGNAVGSGPHWHVSGRDHALRINAVMVGETSKGRKGTAWGSLKPLLRYADQVWIEARIASGLSSGEGLIWAVRDPIYKKEPVREKKRIIDYQDVMTDPGIDDKRLLAIEEEFASTLRVMARDGSTLSAIIRQAWDDGDLRTLTKNSPARSTGAHISILGHSTKDELLRYLDSTETGNGFANRFMWACVRRSKELPDGGRLDSGTYHHIGNALRDVIQTGQHIQLIERDDDARELWRAIYGPLSEGMPGLKGAILSRSEAQVMRLAAIYAIFDKSDLIVPEHLEAALAVWQYVERSVDYIFGDALGDPVADTILQTLRKAGPQTRTDLRDLFARHVKGSQIDRALTDLFNAGKVSCERENTGGRPKERWYAV